MAHHPCILVHIHYTKSTEGDLHIRSVEDVESVPSFYTLRMKPLNKSNLENRTVKIIILFELIFLFKGSLSTCVRKVNHESIVILVFLQFVQGGRFGKNL